MKTILEGYPETKDFDIVEIKAIEVELKFILKDIEARGGVMSLLSSFNSNKHTFSYFVFVTTNEGLKVYSIGFDLERKLILTITDNI